MRKWRDRQTDDATYWKCQYGRQLKCKARVKTVGHKIVSRTTGHNHLGDAAKVEAAKLTNELKKAAESTSAAPTVIISQCLQNASQSAIVATYKMEHS